VRLLLIDDGIDGFARPFAVRLPARGHDVTLLAIAPDLPVDLDGVTVDVLERLPGRGHRFVQSLDERVLDARPPTPHYLQREWLRAHGPVAPHLERWLVSHAASFDVAAFFSHARHTTWAGLPIAAAHTATVLHPLAGDGPALRLPIFESTFRLPAALAFASPEEADLVRAVFRPRAISDVVAFGIDDHVGAHGTDDSNGPAELRDYIAAYERARPGTVVLARDGSGPAAVEPSYSATFAPEVARAWARGRPVLVQGRNPWLRRLASRTGGALPYAGYAGFAEAVDLLHERPNVAAALGDNGRNYVAAELTWDGTLDRYERLLRRVRR
jgi:hypothetical protein